VSIRIRFLVVRENEEANRTFSAASRNREFSKNTRPVVLEDKFVRRFGLLLYAKFSKNTRLSSRERAVLLTIIRLTDYGPRVYWPFVQRQYRLRFFGASRTASKQESLEMEGRIAGAPEEGAMTSSVPDLGRWFALNEGQDALKSTA
jgi:hypothetical protein